jgi:predicted nucleic acid-binding protein
MIFAAIPRGATIFIDANTFIYHFTNDPNYGTACTQLLKRVELKQLHGFTSGHVLGDVVHRLMTLEAMKALNWPQSGIAARLRKHRSQIHNLTVYRQAISHIPLLGVQVHAIDFPLIEAATLLCQQYDLLTGDALVVAVMQANGFTNLASNDTDFDSVPGITRYAPV